MDKPTEEGLCKFRDALGVPGQGFHSVRLFNVAILDVAGTFLLAWIVSRLSGLPYLWSLLLMFLLGIFMHWLFCVPTTVNILLTKK